MSLSYKEAKTVGLPICATLIERGWYIANGIFLCAYQALENDFSLNVAGGTHHAFADHGEGFCVMNDIAIAVNIIIANRTVRSILIVDLDVHKGNGTADIFRQRPKMSPLRKLTNQKGFFWRYFHFSQLGTGTK